MLVEQTKGRGGSPVLEAYPERANLYRLSISPRPTHLFIATEGEGKKKHEEVILVSTPGARRVNASITNMRRLLAREITGALKANGYEVKRPPSRLIIDVSENRGPQGSPLRLYTAFDWRIMWFDDDYYLCLDHRVKMQVNLSVASLLARYPSFKLMPSQSVFVQADSEWIEGRFIELREQTCIIVTEDDDEIEVHSTDVAPRLTRPQIDAIAPALKVTASVLEQHVKKLSFLLGQNAPRARFDACNEFAQRIANSVFPITGEEASITLDPRPAVLRPPAFVVDHDLVEPEAAFDHVDQSKRAAEIREGLISYGAYERAALPLRLVLIGTRTRIDALKQLVKRLNDGSVRYRGALPTYGSRFEIVDELESRDLDRYDELIREFVRSPAREDTNLALVYLPRAGNTADLRHPYFRTKGLLLREGLASQMVDEQTVQDPRFKDLSLSLQMYAKAGYAPWVLDEAIPDVDIFIGISSSFIKERGRITRTVGYVNIFDNYGRWRFYQGETIAAPYEDRLLHYDSLVRNSLAAYRAEHGGSLRSVHFHQTKRFSEEERRALAGAVQAVVPNAEITFVHVNPDHALRLYDLSSPDGRIRRATYLRDDPKTVYLATTGDNIYSQRSMGTPIPLALEVHGVPVHARDLHAVAQQVLSLTRLNWASSHSFCHEPITTKFAGSIAYFMNAFLQDPSFQVNPALRQTPWFL